MKQKRWIALCCLVGMLLLGLTGCRMGTGKDAQTVPPSTAEAPSVSSPSLFPDWDISNLEFQTNDETLQELSLDEAVTLYSALFATPDRYSKEQLLELEAGLREESGADAKYYQFDGTFSLSGTDAVYGTMQTLIVVADADKPYIYSVVDPHADIVCEEEGVVWNTIGSFHEISLDKRRVTLAALGYLSIQDGESIRISNNLHPEFHVPVVPVVPAA